MFRKTIATLATGLAALMLTGLAHARDQIQIVGSSTVYPFATVVAEKHGQRGSMKTPVIESTGTGGGMKLFCAGLGPSHPDFTNASRAIKGSEKELCAKNGVSEIIEIIVGNDGIAFANNSKSQKLNFTPGQLWMAMAENGPKPKTWNEIDASLPNAPIKILAPPPPLEPVMLGIPSSWVQDARKPEWFLVRNVMASEKTVLLKKLAKMTH